MKKANVAGLERMAANYLQHLYRYYLNIKKNTAPNDPERDVVWADYNSACNMLAAFGCGWQRTYSGDPADEDAPMDISNYRHFVSFPDDNQCAKLNFDAWKD